ncbi:hypothetical protein B0T10DRAFT_567313 [Thelonectria olida]|uniref:Uncharacterized protein n=1 Tax=Thelonectria olida TaxID=1576542 RepID=A0A9P8VT23_9HYPO|nr:hypothetical protein B0T10DRAFT_567313 [Thelonectria olida]
MTWEYSTPVQIHQRLRSKAPDVQAYETRALRHTRSSHPSTKYAIPVRKAQSRPPKPYTPEEYSAKESAYFGSDQSWEDRNFKMGITKIHFGESFPITDAHIDAIVSMGVFFYQPLRSFQAGDAETGKGGALSDAAILRLATACPNLVHVSLDGARGLTDDSLLALLRKCKNLRYVKLSGHVNAPGSLKDPALDVLRNTPDMGKQLVKMRLTDQHHTSKQLKKAIKGLSAARRRLAIEVGFTQEKWGTGVNTWLGGKEGDGYQAFGGPGGFDQYEGYGGYGRRFY